MFKEQTRNAANEIINTNYQRSIVPTTRQTVILTQMKERPTSENRRSIIKKVVVNQGTGLGQVQSASNFKAYVTAASKHHSPRNIKVFERHRSALSARPKMPSLQTVSATPGMTRYASQKRFDEGRLFMNQYYSHNFVGTPTMLMVMKRKKLTLSDLVKNF